MEVKGGKVERAKPVGRSVKRRMRGRNSKMGGILPLTLPLAGRVDRWRVAQWSGWGSRFVETSRATNSDPHPQPLPARGRGAH